MYDIDTETRKKIHDVIVVKHSARRFSLFVFFLAIGMLALGGGALQCSARFLPLAAQVQSQTESSSLASLASLDSQSSESSVLPPPPPHPDTHIGVYLSATSMARPTILGNTYTSLSESNGNAFVFDVKGSFVYFDSSSPIAATLGLQKPLYDLPAILAEARARGIYTIGRFIALKDDGLSTYSQTLITHPKTGRPMSQGWVDPANQTVLAYNSEIICDLARAGIDEINLDYIRFSTGYVGELRAFSGQEKADRVEQFIKMARDTINTCGPQTKLGLSTYAILGWDYAVNLETLGQDVVRFAPLVDVISPMAYPATFTSPEYYVAGRDARSRMYHLVYRTLTGYKKLLGDQAWKIRPWIQGYSVSAHDMQEQMDAVFDAGSCGFTVWNANNNYGPVYKGMQLEHIPEHCKQLVAAE